MDPPLKEAYEDLEEGIKEALREHRGNQSVISVALNALLAYPHRPFGFGNLVGREFNPETQRREPFLIAATRDLDENIVYAKERMLVAQISVHLTAGGGYRLLLILRDAHGCAQVAGRLEFRPRSCIIARPRIG